MQEIYSGLMSMQTGGGPDSGGMSRDECFSQTSQQSVESVYWLSNKNRRERQTHPISEHRSFQALVLSEVDQQDCHGHSRQDP